MVSYPHRPKSGHITCYLNRTYHVPTTLTTLPLAPNFGLVLACPGPASCREGEAFLRIVWG